MSEEIWNTSDVNEGNDFSESRFDVNEVYTPPSQLKFRPELKERFREQGFYLKWVYNDKQSIRKRMHPSEGYTLVTPEELGDDLLMIGDPEELNGTAIITNGDLVLMKVRIEKAEARRKYFQNKTKAQSDAINQQLRQNSIENNGSRSIVRTGKEAHFSS